MEPVKSIISRIPAWQGVQNIQIKQIGGLTNSNYLITVNGERFALRVSGQNTERLGINRDHEVAALSAAANAGIGPEIIAFLPPEGHLVTRWIDGRHWDVKEYRTPENVRLFTETVKRIHSLPATGATFSPFKRVITYLAKTQELNVPLPAGFDSFIDTMQSIETDQKNDSSDWLHFCHNDLVSVNYLFLEQEHQIKVLDWEFSGLGDIYYDLATIVFTHDSDGPIPFELEEIMLEHYFGTVNNFQRLRLMGMKYMLMLFTGMWGLTQHGMVQAGLIPAVEDFDYLEFSEYLFSHDIHDLQLQYTQMKNRDSFI